MDERLSAHLELAGLSNEEFVDRAYRLIVRRPPEPEGRERALEALRAGHLSRAALLAELAASEEFMRIRALDEAIAFSERARRAGDRPRLLRGPATSDERVIEIPWALARLRAELRVIDIGYANAEPAYLVALVAACSEEPIGADLVETPVPGLRSVVADARSLPFDDASFDTVLCISTLEHVGFDNRLYGGGQERDEEGIVTALKELHRVLDDSGRVLITVPCGRREDHLAFVQLPPAEWLETYEQAGFHVLERETYARGPEEWSSADETDVASLHYGDVGASAVLCAELRPLPLRKRARRGLARVASRGA